MSKPVWTFVVPHIAEPNVDPVQEEFFDNEEIKSSSDALVRESVQNSLDAAIAGGQVRVRFTFPSKNDWLQPGAADWYFGGVGPHLKACSGLSANAPTFADPVSFLLVEDFGTRGLRGDPEQAQDKPGQANDFYYFWRNIGRGRKEGDDRGRWGLGKIVFPAASRSRCFFGLTVRAEDHKSMLMGQAVLKTHHLDGKRYNPYGYFGLRRSDEFTMPVESDQSFRKHFRLSRNQEPGLSVVIPHPNRDISAEKIASSVLLHYFWPILSGELVVEIDNGGNVEVFSKSTLAAAVRSKEPSRDRLVSLAAWALAQDDDAHANLFPPNSAPRWERDATFDESLKSLTLRFSQNQRIAVRVPVTVQLDASQAASEKSSFHIYLERDDSVVQPEQAFIRHGMTISGVTSIHQGGVRGIVNIDAGPLSTFLGDAENVAHTKWEERTRRFRDKYTKGPLLLRFVKNSLKGLVSLLTEAPDEEVADVLRHIFYVNADVTDPRRDGQPTTRKQKGENEPGAMPVIPAGAPRGFALSKVAGGFSVTGRKEQAVPPMLEFEVAYYIRRKNPFKAYSPFDFDLTDDSIQVRATDAKVLYPEARNCIRVVPQSADFSVHVRGFDPNRDLIVRQRKISDDDLASSGGEVGQSE